MKLVAWDPTDGAIPDPVSPDTIVALLAERGFIAPPTYARFAADHGGERFASGHHRVDSPDTGRAIGLSTVLHYADNQPRHSAADVWEQVEDELDPRLLPIATTNFAGLVCLDYRAGGEPRVVSYDFEASSGREVVLLAETFEDLCERLTCS